MNPITHFSLTDMGAFADVNAIYAEYFTAEIKPARAVVQDLLDRELVRDGSAADAGLVGNGGNCGRAVSGLVETGDGGLNDPATGIGSAFGLRAPRTTGWGCFCHVRLPTRLYRSLQTSGTLACEPRRSFS